MAVLSTAKLVSRRTIDARFRDPEQRRRVTAVLVAVTASAAAAAAVTSAYYHDSFCTKLRVHNSLMTGNMWIQELLNAESPRRIHESLGMHKHVFIRLVATLGKHAGILDTRYVTANEQVALFLVGARENRSNRSLQERFQRSGSTVSYFYNLMLHALTEGDFYNLYMVLPEDETPDEIKEDTRFYPFFKDARGALDGSFFDAVPPALIRGRYRNRKGDLAHNVLAACRFDMRFSYVLTGWEGSACDTTVFTYARGADLAIPAGSYYLADAGYAHCDALLVPYRGVRYHLREWTSTGLEPKNAKELFNKRHASARNVIERCFGVVKKRFAVLRGSCNLPIEGQARIIPACLVVHNFICIHDPDDDLLLAPNVEDNAEPSIINEDELGGAVSREELQRADARRDKIAEDMWADYCERRRRGRRQR